MEIRWFDGAQVSVRAERGETVIAANRAGLLSLAAQFAALAEETPGSHIHYDEDNALEEGSSPLIAERVD